MDFLSHDAVSPDQLDALLDKCFGPARQKRTAAMLRQDAERLEAASFVALDGDKLVGSVECWKLEWQHPRGSEPLVLLGPLVSDPDRRGERIGVMLMDLAVAELEKLGLPVMLIGDEPYYGRWGFSARATGEWVLPGPVDRERLLLKARNMHHFRGPATIAALGTASQAA